MEFRNEEPTKAENICPHNCIAFRWASAPTEYEAIMK